MWITAKWMTVGMAGLVAGNWMPDPSPGFVPPAMQSIQQMDSATVRIGGREVVVSIEAWRNLMPVPGRNRDTLSAGVRLTSSHARGLPEITSVSIKVHQPPRSWNTTLSPVPTTAFDPAAAEYIAHGGPRLSVGSHAQVRVDIQTGPTRTTVTIPVYIGAFR